MPAPCNACPARPVGRNYRSGVEFPDLSGTPLACPGATTQEHDPVWERTREFVPLNPILADQVWARGIQQGGPISLGTSQCNEIRSKKYHSPGIPVPQLRQNYWNLSCAIPLWFCTSNMRLP